MKISIISDMHGNLKFSVPESDLLLIAGDLCPASHERYFSVSLQANWLSGSFRKWLEKQPIKECVAVSGNHDWIWEVSPNLVPNVSNNFHYLEDNEITLMGLRIYGTPVQPPFCDWAFNRDEKSIQKYWDNIPKGIDILLCHCPPYGILDQTQHPNYEKKRIGSESLKNKIVEVCPKYVIFGHNHGEHGILEENGITYINASLLNESYKLVKEPIVLNI